MQDLSPLSVLSGMNGKAAAIGRPAKEGDASRDASHDDVSFSSILNDRSEVKNPDDGAIGGQAHSEPIPEDAVSLATSAGTDLEKRAEELNRAAIELGVAAADVNTILASAKNVADDGALPDRMTQPSALNPDSDKTRRQQSNPELPIQNFALNGTAKAEANSQLTDPRLSQSMSEARPDGTSTDQFKTRRPLDVLSQAPVDRPVASAENTSRSKGDRPAVSAAQALFAPIPNVERANSKPQIMWTDAPEQSGQSAQIALTRLDMIKQSPDTFIFKDSVIGGRTDLNLFRNSIAPKGDASAGTYAGSKTAALLAPVPFGSAMKAMGDEELSPRMTRGRELSSDSVPQVPDHAKPKSGLNPATAGLIQPLQAQAATADVPPIVDAFILNDDAVSVVAPSPETASLDRSSPNAQQLARPELPRAVINQISQALATGPDRPIEVTLDPVELGRVRLFLSAQENSMVFSVIAERADTIELIRRNIDLLAQDFRSLGYDDFSFDFSQSGFGSFDDEASDDPHAPMPVSSEVTPAAIRLTLASEDSLDIRL